jgi:hypothetical protein
LDKETCVRNRIVLTILVSSLLLGLSPLSAAPVITRGIDVFTTPADGRTFSDFSQHPIPAGFFCKNSKAFAGKVAYKGLPLATNPPGALSGADTIIERLDDAAFDDKGTAATRIQFRALSLVSIAPLKTACGAFHAYVTLVGKQRITTMNIIRTQENGGDFIAPLAVDARVTFIPVKPRANKAARKLELTRRFTFPATTVPWSLVPVQAKRSNPLAVDTNGDLAPDTVFSDTSNFLAGQSPNLLKTLYSTRCSCCPGETYCHADGGDDHCTTLVQCSNMQNCC